MMHPRINRVLQCLISLIIALIVGAGGAGLVSAQGQTALAIPLVMGGYIAPTALQSRFGVGAPTDAGGIDKHSLASLGGSWYWDWTATPDAPLEPGVDYYPTIRLSQVWTIYGGERHRADDYTFHPDEATIAQVAEAHPGTVWFIGNEPDRIDVQDDLEPHVYARAYHDLYALIKRLDPTALVAAGQIVQPTPLRLQYLDMVLEAYQQTYGTRMPVDVWAIHAYPLREDAFGWGADIPPGVDATLGLDIELDQVIDVSLFETFIRDFRQWMAERGYRECPLIISEFGILMPEDYEGMGVAEVLDYMTATFDFLMTARDEQTGCPYDDNRLAQRWAWYSLARPADPLPNDCLAGNLYDGATGERLPAGDHYAAYTASLPRTVNLTIADLYAEPQVVGSEEGVSLRLTAKIVNNGTISTGGPVEVHFYDGDPRLGGSLIGSGQSVRPLPGAAIPQIVTVTVDGLSRTEHHLYAVVDPDGEISETSESDNSAHIRIHPSSCLVPLVLAQ